MGYCVTATGECTLIATTLPPKYMIVDIKNDLKENGSCMVDVSLFGGQLNLLFDGKYYGHEIKEDLKIIAKYITDGHFDFVGEDGERWRLKFEEGVWNELEGRTIYGLSELTTDELVDELRKRGYNVIKEETV